METPIQPGDRLDPWRTNGDPKLLKEEHGASHVCCEDRISEVKTFTRDQCERGLRITGIQKTVQKSLLARLRYLDRQDVNKQKIDSLGGGQSV